MDSPLAKIQLPSRAQASPRLTIPEFLTLPDGRQFRTQDLINQVRDQQNYNLRNKNPTRPINRRTTKKYTEEDFRWMATAEIEDIQQRYGINMNYATALRSKSRSYIWYGKKYK